MILESAPTKAECFGISFAEAQAFGLPPIAYNVQAIPEVVIDGVTGLIFDVNTDPVFIARRVVAVYQERSCYMEMAMASRVRFINTLNWGEFGRNVSGFIKSRI